MGNLFEIGMILEGDRENPIEKFTNFTFNLLEWWEYIIYIGGAFICVLFAGLMSGLSLGLLSFDPMTLEILSTTGTKIEKARAKKIMSLVKHKHWLLCTLLIMNALSFEALPIFLDELVPSTVAILISVSFILIAGEIIPQSLCSRYALVIGSWSFYMVLVLMVVTAPISWPLAKILDCLLGKNHVTFFRRAQLKELVSLHGEDGRKHPAKGELPLNIDEINVIRGALELSNLTIESIMTDVENVYMVSNDAKMDLKQLQEIEKEGHSRIPIFEGSRDNVIGVVLVKTLITLNPSDATPLKDSALMKKMRKLYGVCESTPVWDLLNIFQELKTHMAVVFKKEENEDLEVETEQDKVEAEKKRVRYFEVSKVKGKKKIVGVVTLEDVIEELIQEEIIDETDVFVDLNTHLRVADMYRRISIYRSRVQKKSKSKDNLSNEEEEIQVGGNPTLTIESPQTPKSERREKKETRKIELKEMKTTLINGE